MPIFPEQGEEAGGCNAKMDREVGNDTIQKA